MLFSDPVLEMFRWCLVTSGMGRFYLFVLLLSESCMGQESAREDFIRTVLELEAAIAAVPEHREVFKPQLDQVVDEIRTNPSQATRRKLAKMRKALTTANTPVLLQPRESSILQEKMNEVQKLVTEIQALEARQERQFSADVLEELNERQVALKQARRELGKLQLEQETRKPLKPLRLGIQPVSYAHSADFASEYERVFNEMQRILSDFPHARFEIVGHTCNQGTRDHKQSLSLSRASKLRDFLVKRGVGNTLLTVRGAGDQEPAGPNTTDLARSANHRVEVEIID